MKRNKVFIWTLLLTIDVSIAVLIGEAWVRTFIPVKNICYSVHEKIGVVYCPHQSNYGHVEDGYANLAATNSIGSHDIERDKRGKKPSYRIQIYGDSMVAGMGVPVEQTIPMLIQTILESYVPDANQEVLNMGIGTESTAAQLTAYEEIGKEYDADLVACLFLDDFGDNVRRLSGNVHAPYFDRKGDGSWAYVPPLPKDTTNTLSKLKREWCFLYRLLANKFTESRLYFRYKQWKGRRLMPGGPDEYEAARKAVYLEEAWPVTLWLIQRFSEVARRDGREFVLMDGRRFDDNVGTAYTNKDLEAFCEANGIPYFPVYEVHDEISSSDQKSDYFLIDGHPNARGNRKFSEYIAERMAVLIRERQADPNRKPAVEDF